MKYREIIIENYIDAYNNFDVDRMVFDFDDAIKFVNISNGEVNMTLLGLKAFKEQAEQAKSLFSERKQTVKSFRHEDDNSEIDIGYYAILAMNLSNGMKKGDELNLTGRSIFKFSGKKIIELTDIS